MRSKKEIGILGEELSCKYLIKNGYKIIERNYLCAQGEIDIIAFDCLTKEIVFIEVKTRTNFKYGFPSDSVNMLKKTHIKRAINYYVYKHRIK